MRPKIIKQHDYLSVDFGNGRRLTVSRSGEKASGAVPRSVFDAWSRAMRAPGAANYEERIDRFVANIQSIWPEWSTPPRAYAVGERVSADFGKRGGVRSGVVEKVLRSNYTVRFDGIGLVRIAGDMLQPA